MNSEPMSKLIGVGKDFAGPAERLTVLDNIDLTIEVGESVAILGASGSGKTTLLHMLGTLDAPSSGQIFFAGADLGAMELAREALNMVGLGKRLEFTVTTLSGGERQRAAIARAILLRPKALLADEPTGNLDEKNGRMVGELLVALNRDLGMTFVVVTHNIELAGVMGRRLELRSGALYAQG